MSSAQSTYPAKYRHIAVADEEEALEAPELDVRMVAIAISISRTAAMIGL